jgi:vancomycin resistance protein YoaR
VKNINSRKFVIVLSIILLAALAFPVRNYCTSLIYKINTYLPNNLYVEALHLGGMTLEQAKAELIKLEEQQLEKHITIVYEAEGKYMQKSTLSYMKLGYFADVEKLMNQLEAILDPRINPVKRLFNYQRIEKSKLEYSLTYGFYYDRFIKALEVFDDSKLKAPKDAAYKCIGGKVTIEPEADGYTFDKDALYKELMADLSITTAKLRIKPVKPFVTTKQLEAQGVKDLISSFTTRFSAGNVPRASNIRLAAQIIGIRLLPPGGTFSFNETVGERTEERGFKEAGVYVNGKVDTGIGGGICQVSTTLYNAVLLADLPVIERSSHSLTVPYVPLSRDAAVSWGAQDFKFNNNTEHYILINCKAGSNTITFELYGTKNEKTVELISTTISKLKAPVQYIDDPTALIGKEEVFEAGYNGFHSQLTKNIYVKGVKISSELVSKDRYMTAMKIIKRGTKLPEIQPGHVEGY